MNANGTVSAAYNVSITYDANANLTGRAGWIYSYDAQNRLVKIQGGNLVINQHYDPLNRIVQNVNGVVTSYVFDNWNRIEERPTNRQQPRCYLFGAGTNEVVVSFGSGYQNYFYFQDGRGNTSHRTDNSNTLVERYTYDLDGSVTYFDGSGVSIGSSGADNRFLFAGAILLPETNLYDMRNRIYFPLWSRFLQTDPLGLQIEGERLSAGQKARFSPGGVAPDTFTSSEMNLYRYCGNDPVDGSDPLGTISEVMVEGNEITIRVPMRFTGAGVSPKLIARYIDGIQEKWTGTFGPYKVTTTVDTEHGLRKGNRFNEITVLNDPNYRSRTIGSKNGIWANSGSKEMAGHEGGHDLGLPDRYTDLKQKDGRVRSIPNPGYEQNVMGNMAAPPSAADIQSIIGNKRVNDIIQVRRAEKP